MILFSRLLEEIETGHYCRICELECQDEQFSGQAIEDKDDIFGFLEQS